MRIYFDDIRDPPLTGTMFDKVIRTPEELIDLIRTGVVRFISFDHDMGDTTPLTGYDVAKEVEKLAAEGKISPIDYSIHSGNIVGCKNIDAAMKSAWRFWK